MFVLTHSAAETAAPGFTFVGHDFETAVETVKAAAGEKYVAILGASTTKQVLHAGLLDEILVRIASVLLGDGVRLLDHPGGTKAGLAGIMLTESPTVTDLWLRVRY